MFSSKRFTSKRKPQPEGVRPSLRICMVVHSHYPVGEPRVEREARSAVEAGHVVDVVCLRARDERASERLDGIRIVRLPVEHVRKANTFRFLLEYLRFAWRATFEVFRIHRAAPIDVVYVHGPPDFLIVCALIPKLLGSGVVLDIHDLSAHMFDVRFGRHLLGSPARAALRLIERGACAIADQVVTVHEPYRDELVDHGVPRQKISVVMNAPEPSAIERAKTTVDPAGASSFVVAYHGTVNYWYGVDLLVEAIGRLEKRVSELRGLILGEGDALPAVEQLARQIGINGQLEFSRAYLPYAEVLGRVAGASCGVIPNRPSRLNRFALSSKLLEYVALGVPVVVARLETLAAHFDPAEVTFFEPGDPQSLAEGIAWVAENPDDAHEKTERARRRAEDYSWPANRERLLEAISCAGS